MSKKEVTLDRFVPREYQAPLLDAIELKGYRRALLIWPRRAGKDIAAFNLAIRAAMRKPQERPRAVASTSTRIIQFIVSYPA